MACRGVGRCGNRIGNFRLAARKQNRAQASGRVADSAAGRSGRDAAARQGDDEVRRRAQARCAAETEGRLGHRCGLQEAQGRRQRWQRSGGERQWWQSGGGERRRRRRGGGGERRPVAHAWRLWLGEQLGLAPRVVPVIRVSRRLLVAAITTVTAQPHTVGSPRSPRVGLAQSTLGLRLSRRSAILPAAISGSWRMRSPGPSPGSHRCRPGPRLRVGRHGPTPGTASDVT